MKSVLLHHRSEAMTQDIVDAVDRSGLPVELVVADSADEAIGQIADAELLLGFYATDALLQRASGLRWIQTLGVGIDGFARLPSFRADTLLTTAAGLHDRPVSEAALALMFALAKQLPRAVRAQQQGIWDQWMPRLLDGSEVVIVGVGAIGSAIGRKCKALGMRVTGISSRTDAVPGFDRIVGYDALSNVLPGAAFAVLCCPLTTRTTGLFNNQTIAAMSNDAFLVNVGRGGLVIDADLIDAIEQGNIAGAALDVFAQEPLPADHPYWRMPAVLMTPHRSGYHPDYGKELAEIVIHNIRAYLDGNIAAMRNRICPG